MKINLNDESNLAFTYSQLNSEQRELALNAAIEIKARERAIWENILAIGNKLIEVKQSLGHGYFTDWIQKEFEWHETYARKYMKIAEELGKAKRDDRLVLPNSLTALYQLAAGLSDSESDEEKNALIGRVEQETESKGKALTEAEIKKIRAEIESEFRSKQESLFDELRQTQQQVTDAHYKVECATRQQVPAESENKKLKEYKRYYEEIYQQKKLMEGDLRHTKDELSQLNKRIEKLAQEKETEKNKAVKEYVAKNSAQLQQQRDELQQSLEYRSQEHYELQLKIEQLKTEYDHVHDLNSHRQGLRNLMSLFQEINQQQSLILNPPADMMEEYKVLIKQFRLWADVMEDVISEEKNQPIIDVSTKVKS